MSKTGLVSVITPFLNAERFIQEAIDSVLAQTYANWELLLIDDGSTDGSRDIALKYAEQYPNRVRYLEHEKHQNRGRSESRNLGIHHANGEYIAMLDADDVWLPDNLEHLVSSLEMQPEAAMLYNSTQRWYSWTGDPADLQRDNLYNLGISTEQLVKPPALLNLLIQQKISAPCTCSVLIRRNCLRNTGLFEVAFSGMHDDQAFYAKIFLNASVYIADGYGAKYRKHPDSCVAISRKTGQADAAHLNFLNWLKENFIENKVQNSELWKSLHQQLWRYRYIVLKQFLKDFLYSLKLPRGIKLKYLS